MSKKHKNQSQTPSPSDLLGKTSTPAPEKPTTPEAPKVEAKVEVSTLEQAVQALPEGLREKALEELRKLTEQAKKNEAAKAFVAFDNALKDVENGLPKFIGDLAKKYGADLSSRRITITYPDGKFAYTNSPKGSKNGGNGRKGFPAGGGEAELVGEDGKVVQSADSPSKLAETLSLQVEGMRDMKDVFENPHERGTKAELPKRYKVDAVRGEHFRVTIAS